MIALPEKAIAPRVARTRPAVTRGEAAGGVATAALAGFGMDGRAYTALLNPTRDAAARESR